MFTEESRPCAMMVVALLLATTMLPTTLAETSTGSLTLGALTLPTNSSNTVRFLGLIHNDAANLSQASLQSEAITLCKYEAHFAEVAAPEPLLQLPMSADVQETCFPLTHATVTLSPDAGWIGLRPREGGMANLTTFARASVEPHATSTLSSIGGRIAGSDDDRKPRFREVISEDHLMYSTSGVIEYRSDGELRFMGPDAHVEAAENSSDYTTGEETRGGTPNAHERIMRWIVVRYDAATVTLETSTSFLLAARDVPRLVWDGNATIANVRGALHANGQEYAPSRPGESAYVEGTFTGSLTPTNGGKAATVALSGDLRGTSLQASARAPIPGVETALPWFPPLFAAVVVVAGAAAIIAFQKRQNHPNPAVRTYPPEPARVAVAAPPTRNGNGLVTLVLGSSSVGRATAYEERADCLADGRSWLEAADLYGKVRRLDPARPDVAMKQGVALFYAGRLRLALASFQDAALLCDDGDAETWAARCLVRLGEMDAAEAVFLEGLARTRATETLDVMETLGDLENLRDRRKVRDALDTAWDRERTN